MESASVASEPVLVIPPEEFNDTYSLTEMLERYVDPQYQGVIKGECRWVPAKEQPVIQDDVLDKLVTALTWQFGSGFGIHVSNPGERFDKTYYYRAQIGNPELADLQMIIDGILSLSAKVQEVVDKFPRPKTDRVLLS